MRPTVAILACLLIGGTALVRADPPTTTPAPATSSASAASEAAAPAASPSAPDAPATVRNSAPAQAPATEHAASAKPASYTVTVEATALEEKQLRARGYKPEMVNGEQIWCRKETSLGSRLDAQKTCGTAKSLALSMQQTQDSFTDVTKNKTLGSRAP